jgi:hypothetical protein
VIEFEGEDGNAVDCGISETVRTAKRYSDRGVGADNSSACQDVRCQDARICSHVVVCKCWFSIDVDIHRPITGTVPRLDQKQVHNIHSAGRDIDAVGH